MGLLLIDARGTETRVDGLTEEQWVECKNRGIIVLDDHCEQGYAQDNDAVRTGIASSFPGNTPTV
jgi:hypothetical protein